MPPSDQPWSEPFAEGILKDVQKSLINTKKIVSVPVNNIKTQYVANLTKVKKSIKKSEYGVIQSEEHCQEVQLDTSKAKNDADKRYSDAIDKKNSAQMAEKKHQPWWKMRDHEEIRSKKQRLAYRIKHKKKLNLFN